MKKFVFDVELYPNYFSVGFKELNTNNIYHFELSKYRDDRKKLRGFLNKYNILISFNGLHYDNIILNCILRNLKEPIDKTLTLLKKTNDAIINDDFENYSLYRKKLFKSIDIDLFCYWSKMVRINKQISLKSLMVQLKMPLIQELPYKPNDILTESQIKEVRKYNINDLLGTEALCNKMESQIKLRFDIHNKYKLYCFSWDGVKIGTNILAQKYSEYSKKDFSAFKDEKTYHNEVKINDLILPIIKFNKNEINYTTKIKKKKPVVYSNNFYTLLDLLNKKTVKSTKELNFSIYYGNVKHDIKSGGIHSYHNPTLFTKNDDEVIHDIDVSGYYPSFGIEWKVSPNHLPGLSDMLGGIKKERNEHKKAGNKTESDTLKLAQNGGYYGNLNNKYSWLYDWEKTLKITINGQLLLCMLSEKFTDNGIEVLMLNTDGITIKYNKSKSDLVKKIISDWEDLSKMEMESEFYEKLVVRDINNYIWIKKDKTYKTKGCFKQEKDIPLGDSVDNLILPKAWVNYFVHNIPVEETIKNETDIFLFCAAPKVSKTYTVYHNNKKQQNLNRFFVSNQGAYLYKQKVGGNLENILADYPVSLLNHCTDTNAHNYDINYNYYINKAKELINDIEPSQLTLF